MKREKESAIRDIRRQVAVLSVGIAEKIMRNKLADEKEQAALIDRLLDEMIETSQKITCHEYRSRFKTFREGTAGIREG